MGKLEESGRRKTKRKNIQSMILGTVGMAGLIGVALVAPNVVGAMGKMGVLPGPRQREIVNRARNRMVRKGLLKRENGFLRLTPRGQAELAQLELREHGRREKRRWDGKWRVLIFDVPNYRKGLRDKMRRTLGSVGFVRLQDSVWVYPHDCEDLVALWKADFKIGKGLLYLIVQEMEGDRGLRTHFGLTH